MIEFFMAAEPIKAINYERFGNFDIFFIVITFCYGINYLLSKTHDNAQNIIWKTTAIIALCICSYYTYKVYQVAQQRSVLEVVSVDNEYLKMKSIIGLNFNLNKKDIADIIATPKNREVCEVVIKLTDNAKNNYFSKDNLIKFDINRANAEKIPSCVIKQEDKIDKFLNQIPV